MSKHIQIALFLLFCSTGYAQKSLMFHDKSFYLIDSIRPEKLGSIDKQLIDSSLTIFHRAVEDTDKIRALFIISEQCFDLNTWRSYNFLLLNMCNKSIHEKGNSEFENRRFKFFLATALNNEAYALHELRNYKAAILVYLRALKIRQEINDLDGVGNSIGNIASVFDDKGDVLNALKFHELGYKYKSHFSGKRAVATALNNLATLYQRVGDLNTAIDYFHKSCILFEEIKDSISLAKAYINMGDAYETQGDFNKTLELSKKALSVYESINFVAGKARALEFCGNAYLNLKKMSNAESCYLESKKLYESVGDKFGVSLVTNNLGFFYKNSKQYDKALELYLLSLKYREEFGVNEETAACLTNIGGLYYDLGDLEKAKEYTLKAFDLAKLDKLPENLKRASGLLKRIYDKEGKYELALRMMELSVTMRDSIRNEQTEKNSYKQQVKYLYDKQQAVFETEQKKELEKREMLNAAENKRKNLMILSVGIGLFLVLVFSFFLFRRFKVEQKQKQTIEVQKKQVENQKHLIEEKQKEIIDSISYAKRLQEAILPTEKRFKEFLPHSFILYKPKDIVAGDFYWMEVVDDLVFVAAADCTGHGVPGAMVSVVCSGALNRAVLEFGLKVPGKILDKTRELVLETFSRSDQDVKDGMDISLACINRKTNKISWSGANNPLWYFENNELKEIVAHKQPIGKSDTPTNFPTHNFELRTGDTLYLFTDGYADQFGGPKGKKFKYKKMAEILIKMQAEKLNTQHKLLNEAFEEWKGELEQVDDVCILGIRIT